VGSLQLSFSPLAQTSSYATALDQSLRLYCRYELCVELPAVSYNKNIVVSSEQYRGFVSVSITYSSIGIFRCDIFLLCVLYIYFLLCVQSHSEIIWLLSSLLAPVCTAPMLSKSEILMSLNSKQMTLWQLAIAEFFPKDTNNRETARKSQKPVWV